MEADTRYQEVSIRRSGHPLDDEVEGILETGLMKTST
jgi:hypothetical protein